jgi:secreted trypsin-like serine protease
MEFPILEADQCGKRATDVMATPVDEETLGVSRQATPNSWPWQCLITCSQEAPYKVLCGCSILGPRWVITSTNCM